MLTVSISLITKVVMKEMLIYRDALLVSISLIKQLRLLEDIGRLNRLGQSGL